MRHFLRKKKSHIANAHGHAKTPLLLISTYAVASVAFLWFFFRLALETYLADSEIWSLRAAPEILDGIFSANAVAYKIFFQGFLNLSYLFADTDWQVFISARTLFALVGIANLGAMYLLCRKVLRSQAWSLFAVLLLASSSFFLHQGFRIRSDLLALFFHLVFMILLLSPRLLQAKKIWARLFVYAMPQALMLACTPKAIYFLLAQVIFVLALPSRYLLGLRRRVFFALTFAASLTGGGALLLAFTFDLPGSFIYRDAIEYFLAGFPTEPSLSIPPYFSAAAFLFVKIFLQQNPLLSFLIYCSALIACTHLLTGRFFRQTRRLKTALTLSSLFLFIALIFHNDRLPFFILSLLPQLCLWSVFLISSLQRRAGRTPWRVFPLLFVLFLIAKTFFFVDRYLARENGQSQQTTIQTMSWYFNAQPGATYYDVIGTLPLKPGPRLYVGPGAERNKLLALDVFWKRLPDVLIRTKKLVFLEPEINQLLERRYVEVDSGIHFKAFRLPRENYDRSRRRLSLSSLDSSDLRRNFLKAFPQMKNSQRSIFIYDAHGNLLPRSGDIHEQLEVFLSGDEPAQPLQLVIPESALPLKVTALLPLPRRLNLSMRQTFGFDLP